MVVDIVCFFISNKLDQTLNIKIERQILEAKDILHKPSNCATKNIHQNHLMLKKSLHHTLPSPNPQPPTPVTTTP